MSPLRIAWLAGIIDGEGCIQAYNRAATDHRRHTFNLQLEVTSTSETMLNTVADILTGLGIGYYLSPPFTVRLSRRPLRRIGVYTKANLRNLLTVLIPHLVVKRPEAERLLRFLERACLHKRYRYQPEDLAMVEELRAMKRKS